MADSFYWLSHEAQGVKFNNDSFATSKLDVIFDTGTSVSYVP